jgi:hypothetical protein
MSTYPKVLGKMIPSDAGFASTTAGRLPARSRRFSSGPPLGHLSRAAREQIPVQLGDRAHDGGTPSRLGLGQRPHVRRRCYLPHRLALEGRPLERHRTTSGAITAGWKRIE